MKIIPISKRQEALCAHIKRCWDEFGFRLYWSVIGDNYDQGYRYIWFRNCQGHTVPSVYNKTLGFFVAPWEDNLDGILHYVVDDYGVLVPYFDGLPYMYHELNEPPRREPT